MSITSKKYDDLYQRAKEDLKDKLGITTAIGRLFLIPLAKVLAGAQKVMYSAIVQANGNILPDLADDEALLRHGKVRLQRTKNPAVQGEYICDVTGDIGATISASQTFSSTQGYLYVLDSAFTFTGTTGQITLRSLTEGLDAELDIGQELKTTAPIPDVDGSAIIDSVSVSPTSAETIEEFRTNILQSYARQPQGGARGDWRTWTEAESGVREVYVYVRQGSPTEVNLYAEAFPQDSTDGHGTPSSAMLDSIKDAIEPEKEPLGVAEIHYLPIALVPVDVDIEGLIDLSLLTSLNNAITGILYEKRPFIAGDDLLTDEFKGVITISNIFDAIKSVAGGDFTDTSFTVDSVSTNKYEFINDEIPYLRNLTNS